MVALDSVQRYFRDARDLREVLEIPALASVDIEPLAQGEYNANYLFKHPSTGKKLVFRVNFGSQMHLEHQIEYEYHALEALQGSLRTPVPYFFDDSREHFDYGVMVMSFCEGRHLNYLTDMQQAADILADVHSVPFDPALQLVSFQSPLTAMLDESRALFSVYESSPIATDVILHKVHHMFDVAEQICAASDGQSAGVLSHIINTELNSTNFLITDNPATSSLVDWEKPLYGDVAQDIAHFLAPTSTFWKTDIILSRSHIDEFIRRYQQTVEGRFSLEGLESRVFCYLPLTCLRGITWCAMAAVEYLDPSRPLKNESTATKIAAYLSESFLQPVEDTYFCHAIITS